MAGEVENHATQNRTYYPVKQLNGRKQIFTSERTITRENVVRELNNALNTHGRNRSDIVYLEKYLLTILGAVACYGLFPIGLGALLVDRFFPKASLRSIGVKFVILGVAVLLAIPSSVWISDQIHAVYSKSIEITVDSANAVSDNLFDETADATEEKSTVIDKAKDLLSDVTGSVAKVIEQFKNVLNRFIEAIAVMIVTTCLIPILVIVFFVWIVKTLFNVPIVVPTQFIKPKKGKHSREERLPRDDRRELPERVSE